MWRSHPLADFHDVARFGEPIERDIDSNGVGLFDCYLLRYPCGLEVALWQFHHDRTLYEIHANQLDLAHIAFHLDVPRARMSPWIRADGSPTVAPARDAFVVMRTDDNGNVAEVERVTSRCEAESIAAAFEARGHKQLYWVAER